ncbi:MAG: hypothetical protein ACREKL_11765 [Chthoniobacterales bacterium]
MARRSRSSFNPLWLLGGAAILVVVFAGGAFFLNRTSDPYRAEPLDVGAYLENSNSLRGNVYRVEGEVLNVLAYSATGDRLISVGTGANNDPIPMLIPGSLGKVNIQKGQKFIFLFEVTDKGILKAKDLTKA